MRAHVIAILAAMAAMTGCFFLGRSTAPTRIVEKVRTVEVQGKTVEVVKVQATATATATDTGKVVTRWKRVVTPAGPCVEEGERFEARNATEAKATETASTAQKQTEVRLVESERVKLVESAKARYGVGALGRLGLDGRLGWGPAGAARIGPVWISLGADVPGRAAVAQALVTW